MGVDDTLGEKRGNLESSSTVLNWKLYQSGF